MAARHIPGKGMRVVKWLRFGKTFFKNAGVAYDLASVALQVHLCQDTGTGKDSCAKKSSLYVYPVVAPW